jgi:hypothetical protein
MGAYKTWRAVIFIKDKGIEPDKLLLLSRLSLQRRAKQKC